MGSTIEINDTLQLTRAQGFPAVLNLRRHMENPYHAKDFRHKIFEFKNKPGIRIYQASPTRNFLVENSKGKWIYWGLVHVLEVTHDYAHKTTGGKFKILYLYTPDEMKLAHALIDRRGKKQFSY